MIKDEQLRDDLTHLLSELQRAKQTLRTLNCVAQNTEIDYDPEADDNSSRWVLSKVREEIECALADVNNSYDRINDLLK